ncbi:ATP-binding cassette domain-containing protein, partial [Burkholderia sp. SIMBA_024]
MNVLVRSENMSNTALGDVTPPLSIIDIRSLTKTYDEKAGPVIDNVSLQIEKGTIHGIIGRSGAGKSTLVRCLNGLVHPSDGKVFVSGRE